MTAKELKELLRDVPDDTPVLVPSTSEFTGEFYSPCNSESGFITTHEDEDSEDGEPAFLIAPHGFGQPKEEPSAELN